jgi:hypothetical protein
MAEEKYRALSGGWVSAAIDDLISSEEFKKEIADEFAEKFGLDEARQYIEEKFSEDRSLSWRNALEAKLEDIRGEHADAFKAAVEKKLRERL